MTQITVDPVLAERLARMTEPVELCDNAGTVIGRFKPTWGKPPPGMECPLSREERECRKASTERYSFSEILEKLKRL